MLQYLSRVKFHLYLWKMGRWQHFFCRSVGLFCRAPWKMFFWYLLRVILINLFIQLPSPLPSVWESSNGTSCYKLLFLVGLLLANSWDCLGCCHLPGQPVGKYIAIYVINLEFGFTPKKTNHPTAPVRLSGQEPFCFSSEEKSCLIYGHQS